MTTPRPWRPYWRSLGCWQEGYDAVMVTDMAVFRNPNHHERTDLPDTLDYDALAGFTVGLAGVLVELSTY